MSVPMGAVRDMGEACVPSSPNAAESKQSASDNSSPPSTQNCSATGTHHGFFRSGGTFSTAVFLTKLALGAGVLSLGFHTAHVGLLFELAFLLAGGVFAGLGVCLTSEATIATRCWTYEEVCQKLCHPIVSYWTAVMNGVACLGAASVGLIACGQVFQVLTGAKESRRRAVVAAVGIVFCGPMSLSPRLGYLRHLAMLSTFSMLLLVVAIAVYLAAHGIHHTIVSDTFWLGRGDVDFCSFMNAASNVVFACDMSAAIPQLTGELTPEPTVRRMRIGASSSGTALVFFYGSASLLSLFAFGVEDNKDTFIVDLEPMKGHPLIIATYIALAFSCIVQFPLMLYPVRQSLSFCHRRSRAHGSEQAGYSGIACCFSTGWVDMLLGVALVLLTVLVAVAVGEVYVILSFVGSLASSWVCHILPGILFIQMRRSEKGITFWSAEILTSVALLVVGVFFSIVGTVAAIVG